MFLQTGIYMKNDMAADITEKTSMREKENELFLLNYHIESSKIAFAPLNLYNAALKLIIRCDTCTSGNWILFHCLRRILVFLLAEYSLSTSLATFNRGPLNMTSLSI